MARRGSYAKGIARREEILDSALDVIGRHGYQNASLRDIAAEVGVSPAALLHYFGTKEELFTAVLRKRDERDGLPADDDSEDARTGFIRAIRHNTEVPGLVELFSRLAVDAADPAHPAHQYFLERNAQLRTLMSRALPAVDGRNGAFDPDTLARIIQAVADGLQLQWMIEPDIDMAGIVDRLITVLEGAGSPAE